MIGSNPTVGINRVRQEQTHATTQLDILECEILTWPHIVLIGGHAAGAKGLRERYRRESRRQEFGPDGDRRLEERGRRRGRQHADVNFSRWRRFTGRRVENKAGVLRRRVNLCGCRRRTEYDFATRHGRRWGPGSRLCRERRRRSQQLRNLGFVGSRRNLAEWETSRAARLRPVRSSSVGMSSSTSCGRLGGCGWIGAGVGRSSQRRGNRCSG